MNTCDINYKNRTRISSVIGFNFTVSLIHKFTRTSENCEKIEESTQKKKWKSRRRSRYQQMMIDLGYAINVRL